MRTLQLLFAGGFVSLFCACHDRAEDQRAAASALSQAPSPPPAPPGVLEGTVRIAGEVPAQPPLDVPATVARVCGKQVPDQTLRASADGTLADAIVFIADAPSEPPPSEPTSVSLDQQRCSFLPAVIAARAGTRMEIHNSDPLVHNVRATSPAGDNWINVALPLEGMKLDRVLPDAAGTWKVHCDVHQWMRGALRTFEHPYFATTDTRGRFRLTPALSGKHRIGVWHPRFPEQLLEVDIPSGGTAHLEASWPAGQLLPR